MSAARIRPLGRADRAAALAIVEAVGVFSAEEVEAALELIDEWLAAGEASEYLCYVVDDGEKVSGFLCFGPTPLTDGTWDIYWIAVHPEAQQRGYGRLLLAFAEAEIRKRDGRLVALETGSHPQYAGTVTFYLRNGYALVSRIPDFYRIGDDRLTLIKQLG